MNSLIRATIIVLAALLSGCTKSDTLWQDGNYLVYKRPHSREIIMGYHFGDGGVLGLSGPTVSAAGADANYVVFLVEPDSYFYIVREQDGEGVSYGPFDKEGFEAARRERYLPRFGWHLEPSTAHAQQIDAA